MDVEDLHGDSKGVSGTSVGMASRARILTVRFRITGPLRFLSHAETLRVLQRACARAGIAVKYSSGFNPHPRLSLPLPRTVGVESEDELLVIRLSDEAPDAGASETSRRAYEDETRQALQDALPEGIAVFAVELADSTASLHARSAEYVFPLRPDRPADLVSRLGRRAETLLASENLIVERRFPGGRKTRRVDVRPFLETIQPAGDCVQVTCAVTAAGSVRIEEIMQLLELRWEDLAAPVRRVGVQWGPAPPPDGGNETRGKP
jgi:radical SAM-linked protein